MAPTPLHSLRQKVCWMPKLFQVRLYNQNRGSTIPLNRCPRRLQPPLGKHLSNRCLRCLHFPLGKHLPTGALGTTLYSLLGTHLSAGALGKMSIRLWANTSQQVRSAKCVFSSGRTPFNRCPRQRRHPDFRLSQVKDRRMRIARFERDN